MPDWGALFSNPAATPIMVALVVGFWAWVQARKKSSAESRSIAVDAQVTAQRQALEGFKFLINSQRAEMVINGFRIKQMESDNLRMAREIDRVTHHLYALEHKLREHNILFTPFEPMATNTTH